MKIGILTWYYGANYGAKLHSFALQKTLERMGHEPYFISFKPKEYKMINKRMNINCSHYRRHPWHYLKCLIRCNRFEDFNKNYNVTDSVATAEEINRLDLDCVILGSDAVFNLHHPLFSDIYFGTNIDFPKFTYAPCCENADVKSPLTAAIISSIESFIGISVRDEKTACLIENNVNVKTQQVLDPTFLYDFSSITPSIFEEKYMLLYTFSDWSCYREQIEEYAIEHNLKVVSVGRFYSWADKSYDDASVYEWLGLMKKAEIVFTDSFHGLCFSIKNEKQFVIVSRQDKRDKNQDLMKKAGISREFYDGRKKIADYLLPNIDYGMVNKNILRLKTSSIRYLEHCLGEVKKV